MSKTKNSDGALSSKPIDSDLEAQVEYVLSQEREGEEFGLIAGRAFVEAMREIGYKHTGTALDELIDNSIQAGCKQVHVVFGFEGRSQAKPTAIAVLDNGHGMVPEMMRHAVRWGGTHRFNDRSGFGRFGYGLPSACVSQGRRYTLYSRTAGEPLNEVVIDLDLIPRGDYTSNGRLMVPMAKQAPMPRWLRDYVKEHFKDEAEVRTAIVIEKLDKTDWSTANGLKDNLLPHFGLVYRNWLRNATIFVEGRKVVPIDPLFITEGAMYYDLDDERAEALPALTIDVRDSESREEVGTVKARFAYMSPTFARTEKAASGKRRGVTNQRYPVMKENNGIIVCREGRQIDVVRHSEWTTFVNNDRYLKVEVDFPASLDEEFHVSTSKQQVVISDRMWNLLREAGVYRALEQMRVRARHDRATDEVGEESGLPRPVERAMEDARKFKTKNASRTAKDEQKAQEVLRLEARRRAKESGVDVEAIERELVAETQGRPYKVEHQTLPGAPFFSVDQRGGQRVLLLNTAHRFFTDVYAGPGSTARVRDAIATMLFVIGDCELDASDPEMQLFYRNERALWSTRLDVTLTQLERYESVPDFKDLEQEMLEANDGQSRASSE